MNGGETTKDVLLSSEGRQPRAIKSSMTKETSEWSAANLAVAPTRLTHIAAGETPRNGRPRSSLKIHLDILETVRNEGPSKPTRIVLAANLSHDRLVRYLAELVSQGLLEENRETTARLYALTARGLDFINQIRETQAFLAEFGLEM